MQWIGSERGVPNLRVDPQEVKGLKPGAPHTHVTDISNSLKRADKRSQTFCCIFFQVLSAELNF